MSGNTKGTTVVKAIKKKCEKKKEKTHPTIISKPSIKSKVTKKMLNKVFNKNTTKMYTVIVDEGNITIQDTENKVIHEDMYNTLTYEHKEDCIMMSNILMSLIYKYEHIYTGEYYLDKYEVGNSLLYVFLLPELSKDGRYVIKVGYTTNLCKRYEDLKKEFNIPDNEDIYLIYVEHIKNESREIKLHNILKKTKNIIYYPTDKYKKNEKSSTCVETYIFNYLTYITIIKEVFFMNGRDLITQKIKLAKEENRSKELEIEIKNKDIELAKIQANKELELAKIQTNKELELAKIQTPLRLKELEIKLKESEIKLKELELAKIQANKT
jgi:hypothetical protein